ncbi:BppU family phage baseplate upper protein [Clostridioides difficile]|nr:BppU family phage baseplate upper protein [Clostridioides difficile]
MRDRIYTVDINTKSYQVAKYKQFDNGVEFKINLLENNIEKDLTGYTAIANFQRPDRKVIYQSCAIEGSIVTTIIENNITAVAGDVIVEFTFYKDDLVVTTFSLKINIEKSIDKNAITEEPKWDFITVIINQVKEVIENIEETEETIKEAENKRVEEFNNIKDVFDDKVIEVEEAIKAIPSKEELKGVGIEIKGSLDNVSELPANPSLSDAYFVKSTTAENQIDLYVWDGIEWIKVPDIKIQGDGLEFDWNGTQLGVRVEGQEDFVYADLKGQKGDSIEFVWNGTELGIRVEGQENYSYADLKGVAGNKLEFNWNGTQLGIREEGQTDYVYTELKARVTWNELLEKPKEFDYLEKITTFNQDGSITDILDSTNKTITKFNPDGTIVDEKYIDNVLVSRVKTTFRGNQIEEIREEVS